LEKIDQKKRSYICPDFDDPSIYFKGDYGSGLLNYTHSYIVYEISKCKNETEDDENPCASEEEIVAWLHNKKI